MIGIIEFVYKPYQVVLKKSLLMSVVELVNSDNTPLGNKVLYCHAGGALLGLLGGMESLAPGKALGDAAGRPK